MSSTWCHSSPIAVHSHLSRPALPRIKALQLCQSYPRVSPTCYRSPWQASRGGTSPFATRLRQQRAGKCNLPAKAESQANEATEQVGIVIVDHGSRRKESNEMLDAFVAMFKESTGRTTVEPAHMEIAEPTIATAFERCVEQGAKTVVISPYFLSPGRHWAQDIPALAKEAAKKHPGVKYLVAAPIGLHPLMAAVIEDRIEHCLSHVAGEVDECGVCRGTGRCQLQAGG